MYFWHDRPKWFVKWGIQCNVGPTSMFEKKNRAVKNCTEKLIRSGPHIAQWNLPSKGCCQFRAKKFDADCFQEDNIDKDAAPAAAAVVVEQKSETKDAVERISRAEDKEVENEAEAKEAVKEAEVKEAVTEAEEEAVTTEANLAREEQDLKHPLAVAKDDRQGRADTKDFSANSIIDGEDQKKAIEPEFKSNDNIDVEVKQVLAVDEPEAKRVEEIVKVEKTAAEEDIVKVDEPVVEAKTDEPETRTELPIGKEAEQEVEVESKTELPIGRVETDEEKMTDAEAKTEEANLEAKEEDGNIEAKTEAAEAKREETEVKVEDDQDVKTEATAARTDAPEAKADEEEMKAEDQPAEVKTGEEEVGVIP